MKSQRMINLIGLFRKGAVYTPHHLIRVVSRSSPILTMKAVFPEPRKTGVDFFMSPTCVIGGLIVHMSPRY